MSAPTGASLAGERTVLAWRRTALSVAVGALVAGRLLAPALGGWSWALSGAGLAGAGVALVVAQRAGHDERAAPAVGALVTAGAAGTLLVGLAALAYLLVPG